jgi:predicted  nucleic acid-binding Zn-ribbon protein
MTIENSTYRPIDLDAARECETLRARLAELLAEIGDLHPKEQRLRGENIALRAEVKAVREATRALVQHYDDEGAGEYCSCERCTARRPAFLQALSVLRGPAQHEDPPTMGGEGR